MSLNPNSINQLAFASDLDLLYSVHQLSLFFFIVLLFLYVSNRDSEDNIIHTQDNIDESINTPGNIICHALLSSL